MGRAIFISYRRDDSEGEAGRLFDDLVRAFGDASVFMDVAGINPGIDFRKAIDDNVATCGVLLAVIGPQWATMNNSAGQRRLDDENDFVRLEIGSALARDIPVIPVLVHEAKMPGPEVLPANLKNLAYRNSVELTHARWNSDVQLLTKALTQYVAATSATSTEPVHATVPVQLPPANAPAAEQTRGKTSRMPLIAGIAVAVVLAIAAVVYFEFGTHPSGTNRGGTPVPAQTTPAASTSTPSNGSISAGTGLVALEGTWNNSAPVEKNGLEKLLAQPYSELCRKSNRKGAPIESSATRSIQNGWRFTVQAPPLGFLSCRSWISLRFWGPGGSWQFFLVQRDYSSIFL